jgi:7,8-dihydropterin-6-yl-methyl-4-(beta-D-ribofuranosyl)aminobenzene 5'-phosphate synthase
VNICLHARALTGGDVPLYGALGGFHLGGALVEPLIPRVVDDLAALDPRLVVPAHCTGWRAQQAMARRFGEAFVPNSVGTRYAV